MRYEMRKLKISHSPSRSKAKPYSSSHGGVNFFFYVLTLKVYNQTTTAFNKI